VALLHARRTLSRSDCPLTSEIKLHGLLNQSPLFSSSVGLDRPVAVVVATVAGLRQPRAVTIGKLQG